MSDDKDAKDDGGITKLLKVLSKHYDILVSAESDHTLRKNYYALLKFLRSARKEDIDRIFFRPASSTQKKLQQAEPQFADSEIADLSIENVEKFINDGAISRNFLERIAIHRFKVPRGSMRSFSNRRMLVEKLATLISNEQTHTAIDAVARR